MTFLFFCMFNRIQWKNCEEKQLSNSMRKSISKQIVHQITLKYLKNTSIEHVCRLILVFNPIHLVFMWVFFVLGHEFYAFFKWFHSTHSKNKQTHTHTDTQSKWTLWGKNSLSFALIWCDNKKVWIVSWKCWQKFNDNVMMKQHNELCGNKTVRSKMANLHTAFGCMHTQRDLQILPTKALTVFSRYYNQLPWPIVWIQTKIRSFFLIGWCTCFWFPFLRFETKCSVKLQSVLNASIRSHMNVYAHAINLEIMMKFL